jgi:hypothetical protein
LRRACAISSWGQGLNLTIVTRSKCRLEAPQHLNLVRPGTSCIHLQVVVWEMFWSRCLFFWLVLGYRAISLPSRIALIWI